MSNAFKIFVTVTWLTAGCAPGRISFSADERNRLFREELAEIPDEQPVSETGATLEVTHRKQQQLNWCWATVAQMAMEALGEVHEQCDVVTRTMSLNSEEWLTRSVNCCSPSRATTPQCDSPFFDFIAAESFGFPAGPIGRQLTEEEIKKSLSNGRPVATHVFADGEVGHSRLITGFSPATADAPATFRVFDPARNEPYEVTYETLSSPEQQGDEPPITWTYSTVYFAK